VAILNVKNVPDDLYRTLRARARSQRRSISQEVIHLLTEATRSQALLSILSLKGLGKECWSGIDPAAHVEEERRAWD
jgi:plasmid stability protein